MTELQEAFQETGTQLDRIIDALKREHPVQNYPRYLFIEESTQEGWGDCCGTRVFKLTVEPDAAELFWEMPDTQEYQNEHGHCGTWCMDPNSQAFDSSTGLLRYTIDDGYPYGSYDGGAMGCEASFNPTTFELVNSGCYSDFQYPEYKASDIPLGCYRIYWIPEDRAERIKAANDIVD